MLYEKYEHKILKLSNFFAWLKSHRILIIAIFAALFAMGSTLLFAKGIIYNVGTSTMTITYGQTPDFETKAFWQKVWHEYAELDSNVWSQDLPRFPGEYRARAVSKRIFGANSYSKERPFRVLPKPLAVSVCDSVVYGEMPSIAAELEYNDAITCTSFDFRHLWDNTSQLATENRIRTVGSELALMQNTGQYEKRQDLKAVITPVKDSVIIVDSNGIDVTACYAIDTIETEVTILPRTITVATSDASKVYDGSPLTSTEYTITEGSLLDGESLLASFEGSITNVGTVENNAQFEIRDVLGADITKCYDIKLQAGQLKIEQRLLAIKTLAAQKVYDGMPLICSDYIILEGSLVLGQEILVADSSKQVLVGTAQNILEIKVTEQGNDVSDNYAISYQYQSLEVTQRQIKIETASQSFTYNGAMQACDDETAFFISSQSELVEFDEIQVASKTYITNVGTATNSLSLKITNGAGDVTFCYDIDYSYGTLTMLPLAIVVTTSTTDFYFTNEEQYSSDCTSNPELYLGESFCVDLGTIIKLKNVERVQGGEFRAYENIFEVCVFRGNEDITYNYSISYNYGSIRMLPALIEIETGSQEFVYNGTEQFDDSFQVPALAEGYTARIKAGSLPIRLREVEIEFNGGYKVYSNVFEVEIYDGVGVSDNYTTTYKYGTLVMKPRPITVTTNSHEWEYDGQSHFDSGFVVTNGSLVLDHNLIPIAPFVELTNVLWQGDVIASVKNAFGLIVQGTGGDLSHNYEINYIFGELTILPRAISFLTASETWIYDGQEHSLPYFTPSLDRLVAGHRAFCIFETIVIDVTGVDVDNVLKIEIWDAQSYDVTRNYQIEYIYGSLKVLPRVVEITTASASFLYDGTEQFCLDYEISLGSFVDGHISPISEFETITNVIRIDGSVHGKDNKLLLIVLDDQGADVSHNYQIDYIYGTLTMNPRPITVKALDVSKEYDTKPLTGEQYDIISSLGLVEGHFAIASSPYSQTEIGESYNIIKSFVIYSGDEDVTYNYDVSTVAGSLIVYPRSIIVIAGSASKIYDGTPLVCEDYYVRGSGLLVGHVLTATTSGSQTAVGISDNIILANTVSITHNGVDVSHYYSVSFDEGELKVAFRRLTVSTGSAGKPYDGTPLVCDSFELDDGLASGDIAIVDVYGSITEIGSVENLATITIKNPSGEDITHEYIITMEFGKLTIFGNTGGLNNDGTIDREGSDEGFGESVKNIVFKATSTASDTIYFRMKSFGNYDTNGWLEALSYPSNEINPLFLTYFALLNSGKQASMVTIEPLMQNLMYMLPYYAQDYPTTEDVLINILQNNTFSKSYIAYNYLNEGGNLSVNGTHYEAFERDYYQYVLQTYLQLPQTTRTALLSIAANNNLIASSPTIIKDVASFVQGLVKYDLNFQEYLGDIAVYFFTQAETGICQHYATAATAMLRALGIPARYTIGFVGKMSANQTVEVSAAQYHAWVEVYIQGLGWVQIEVTGAGEGSPTGGGGGNSTGGGAGNPTGGDANTSKKQLVIKPVDVFKGYDGTPLFAKNEVEDGDLNSYSLFDSLLKQGYRYTVTVAGSRTEIGVSKSQIIEFVLYDQYGHNVSDEYDIVYLEGRIRITLSKYIIINLYSVSKSYDATPLSYNKDDYFANPQDGLTLDFDLAGTLIDVGKLDFEFLESLPYAVFDKGGMDVTDQYSLVFVGKPLTVYKRSIEIKSGSATKVYDGKKLTNDTSWVSKGYLPQDFYFTAVVSGEITDIGTNYNTIDGVAIYDKQGKDVTKNFQISVSLGKLTIVAN